ncbi:GNAT family N-acetyltransferase [Dysgonomonas macrotermitis]|uniref:Acetyltransferase (GNAT) family protein n=1 Tax=Dysgonomonas macrotermitis TaxID=1346286 RepID=A0A1M4UQK6_9BACT|nr:GNAT family N-acetyltransferase [Dysgonomonas macrotermitis]SHE59021.1 Acetyltransferase (GNAT) family protein [Dysgonomonas macrotermitis]
MVINKGKIADIDSLEALYNDLNDHFAITTNYPGWIKHIYPIRETAIEGINEGTLFVATEDEIIAGSIILNHTPEEAYNQVNWLIDADYKDVLVIHTLVVHPSFFRKNIAHSLMEFAKQYAMEHSIKSVRLDVSINNKPAIALYEKMGYQYIGTVDLGLPYEHLKWFRLYELVI